MALPDEDHFATLERPDSVEERQFTFEMIRSMTSKKTNLDAQAHIETSEIYKEYEIKKQLEHREAMSNGITGAFVGIGPALGISSWFNDGGTAGFAACLTMIISYGACYAYTTYRQKTSPYNSDTILDEHRKAIRQKVE